MNDNSKKGIFSSYSGVMDPMYGGGGHGGSQISSPYLNFNPAYITPNSSDYIMPEGASARRGRFELAFSQIGGSVLVGGAVGGVNGLYSGLGNTKELTGAIKRTQMLNYVAKQGAASAQGLGVIALMYSVFGVIVGWARGTEDELNTLAAATATGLLYKSSSGVNKCVRGGAIGLGLAAVYAAFSSRDRIKSMVSDS